MIRKRLWLMFLLIFFVFSIFFIKTLKAQDEIKTIFQAKQEANNETSQTVSGYLTSLPDQLGAQYFYIQDETAGIQVFYGEEDKYNIDFSSLFLGQKIKVKGEIRTANNEWRIGIIQTEDIQILDEFKTISPKEIQKLSEENEGELVVTQGRYKSTSGYNFFLENENGEIKIAITSFAKDNKKITKPKMHRGDLIQVTGIASQYNKDYRLLPRFSEDIKILEYAQNDEGITTETEDTEISLISIRDARNKQKGDEVLVEGLVTVLPNTFSSRYFYIQDGTAGIQIYFSKGNWPNISLGQKIKVLGEMSEAYNEKRIKISETSDISILGQEKEPSPIILKTGSISEGQEGMLVGVSGTVADPSGNLFYLDDSSGKIKIYVKKEAKIEKPRLKQGEKLQITGIVSQYKDAYRILPRRTEDIKTSGGITLAASIKKEVGDAIEENEEIIPDEGTKKPSQSKVLGAGTQRPIGNYWPYGLVALSLGMVGYFINDITFAKREGNASIWQQVNEKIRRWRYRRIVW